MARSPEEINRLLQLPASSLEYLACLGIARNPAIPKRRQETFRDRALVILTRMPIDEKHELTNYMTWKYHLLNKTSFASQPKWD
jgi:hypothetical protein